MKELIFTTIVTTAILSLNICFAQFGLDEIRIFNQSNQNPIRVYFYPVSMNFNADTSSNDFGFNGYYSLVSATRPDNPQTIDWDYNNGTSYLVNNNFVQRYFDVIPGESVGFNIDAPRKPGVGTSLGSFGYGIYKVEIRYPSTAGSNYTKIDSALIEVDLWNTTTTPGDLGIYIDSFNVSRRFTYKFCCEGSSYHNIDTLPGNKINFWESEHNPRRKDYGNYTFRDAPNQIYNQYSIIPQDSRIFSAVVGVPKSLHPNTSLDL